MRTVHVDVPGRIQSDPLGAAQVAVLAHEWYQRSASSRQLIGDRQLIQSIVLDIGGEQVTGRIHGHADEARPAEAVENGRDRVGAGGNLIHRGRVFVACVQVTGAIHLEVVVTGGHGGDLHQAAVHHLVEGVLGSAQHVEISRTVHGGGAGGA